MAWIEFESVDKQQSAWYKQLGKVDNLLELEIRETKWLGQFLDERSRRIIKIGIILNLAPPGSTAVERNALIRFRR